MKTLALLIAFLIPAAAVAATQGDAYSMNDCCGDPPCCDDCPMKSHMK